jgi:hypothetical protein
MSTVHGYALMAEQHWREHRPRMVQQLERENRLTAALREAEQRTLEEMEQLMREFRKEGLSASQAHLQAWELTREKYLLLPPEQ